MEKIMTVFDAVPVAQKFTYEEYVDLSHRLFEMGKTTGPENDPHLLDYTKLNLHRMSKWNKVGKLIAGAENILKNVNGKQNWYVIAESWCGDASQSLPFIAKMAEASEGKINLFILLRDQNVEVMNQYLTNGTRSIPKLIALDAQGEELFVWGPRPHEASLLMQQLKGDATLSAEEKKERLHKWYADNKGNDTQEEILSLLAPYCEL